MGNLFCRGENSARETKVKVIYLVRNRTYFFFLKKIIIIIIFILTPNEMFSGKRSVLVSCT